MSCVGIADISLFENLQNEAHQSMGFSSLSVFNATFKVVDKKKVKENADKIEKRKQDFDREEKFLIRTKPELQKKKVEFEKLQKLQQAITQKKQDIDQMYRRVDVALNQLRVKRITSRSNITHGIKELAGWGVEVTSTELEDDD
jgi:hypothetical protein